MTSTNTYIAWNHSKDKDANHYPHKDSNKIWINSVEKGTTKKNSSELKSAFKMWSGARPTFKFDNKLTNKNKIYNPDYFQDHDVSEVLRGDYQRLIFDVDIEVLDLIEEYLLALYQIKHILDLLNIPITCVHGAAEIQDLDQNHLHPSLQYPTINIVDELHKVFPSIHVFKNPHQHKVFSIHIYVQDYFFDRSSLAILFCDSKSSSHKFFKDPTYTLVKFDGANIEEYCNKANYFSKYIDHSVYKQKGAQQIFRFVLSGKLIQNRPPPEYTNEQFYEIMNNFNSYVSTKTESDTNFISPNDVRYQNLKNWLDSFIGGPKTTHQPQRTPDKILTEEISTEIEHIDKNTVYVEGDYTFTDDIDECIEKNKYMVHINWICTLIKHIKWYVMEHPDATDEEIQKVFTAPYYQYYSHSEQKKKCQPQSIEWCINKIRAEGDKVFNPYSVIRWYHSELRKSAENAETNNKFTCLKYTLNEFKELVKKGVTYTQLAIYIHFTFIFFRFEQNGKNAITQIAFRDERNNFIMNDFNQFMINRSTNPIKVRLYRKCLIRDGRRKNDEGTEEIIKQPMSLRAVFDIFDDFKQSYYDYDIYSLDKDIFSLYCQPTSAEKTEIPEPVKKIIQAMATELDNNDKLAVNEEKYNYILDWFAYILQHPEDKNYNALHLVSVPGIGKNIISNTICQYIGKDFSAENLDINDLLGEFTIQFDKYLFCVINEVDESNKAIDKLKPLITDGQVGVNIKHGAKYQTTPKASLLFYSNHQDTKLIGNTDRRFTYICSRAFPFDKKWYASICEGPSILKKEIAVQFIKHLLSRDLTNYKPHDCKPFDKPDLIDERREESRSPIYTLVLSTLKIYEKFGMNHISKDKVKNMVNEVLERSWSTLTEAPIGASTADEIIPESIFAQNIYHAINYSEDDEGKEFKDVLVSKYPKLTTEDIDEIIELMKNMPQLEMDVKAEQKNKSRITQKEFTKIIQHDDDKYIFTKKCRAKGDDNNKHCIYLKSAIQKQNK